MKTFKTDKQPTKAILNKPNKTLLLDYGGEGVLKIWFKDLNKRPKSIFDSYNLFLNLCFDETARTTQDADLRRLEEFKKNIIKAEKGTMKEVFVYEDLKGGIKE